MEWRTKRRIASRLKSRLAGARSRDSLKPSKIAASKLINDAGAWSAASLKQASAGTADNIKATVAASLATVQADIGAARKAMVTAIWAAVVAVVTGGLFLGIGVGFWLAGR
jgi:glycerol-3-phosphate dehydrogenase